MPPTTKSTHQPPPTPTPHRPAIQAALWQRFEDQAAFLKLPPEMLLELVLTAMCELWEDDPWLTLPIMLTEVPR